jgi:hypothetical protein
MDIHWLLLRIPKDYLFVPRHEEYRQILEVARKQKHRVMSLLEFHRSCLPTLEELLGDLRLHVVAEFPDGVVFKAR